MPDSKAKFLAKNSFPIQEDSFIRKMKKRNFECLWSSGNAQLDSYAVDDENDGGIMVLVSWWYFCYGKFQMATYYPVIYIERPVL